MCRVIGIGLPTFKETLLTINRYDVKKEGQIYPLFVCLKIEL